MEGTLYIVATPIGNLEDITLRAIAVLSKVDIILAEDTRITKKLLDYLTASYGQPPKSVVSYHQHSGDDKKSEILRHLTDGKNIALVTDAGTPGISDPGNELIDFLLERNPTIKIVPVPGTSAIVTALSVSGLNVNKFVFLGFLPKKKRLKLFKWLKDGKTAFAFYESPNRILKTLEVLRENFPEERRVFIARELTKMFETMYRGTISDVSEKLKKEKVKGEIVVVVENP